MTLTEARALATKTIDFEANDKKSNWKYDFRCEWFVENLRVGEYGLDRQRGGWTLWKRTDFRKTGAVLFEQASVR